MIKKTIIAAAIALMMLPTIANAGNIFVRGYGVSSCGTWVQDQAARENMLNWILGFATGMNNARFEQSPEQQATIDLLNGADANAIETWIGNYCALHPLDSLTLATIKLMEATAK